MIEDLPIEQIRAIRDIVTRMKAKLEPLNEELALLRQLYLPGCVHYGEIIANLRQALGSESLQLEALIKYKEDNNG